MASQKGNKLSKFCIFNEDFIDLNGKLIWVKGIPVLVTDEDENNYYFGLPKTHGITKALKDKKFKVVFMNSERPKKY